MKRVLLSLTIVAFIAFAFSSCAATKRDCQGNKKVRLKNGIWM